jgi:hypothetical protein
MRGEAPFQTPSHHGGKASRERPHEGRRIDRAQDDRCERKGESHPPCPAVEAHPPDANLFARIFEQQEGPQGLLTHPQEAQRASASRQPSIRGSRLPRRPSHARSDVVNLRRVDIHGRHVIASTREGKGRASSGGDAEDTGLGREDGGFDRPVFVHPPEEQVRGTPLTAESPPLPGRLFRLIRVQA